MMSATTPSTGTNSPLGGWVRLTCRVAESDLDALSTRLFEWDCLGTRLDETHPPDIAVTAYFPGETVPDALRALLAQQADLRLSAVHVDAYTDTSWKEAYKEHFAPFEFIPNLWIVPSWQEDFMPPRGAQRLLLDPAGAFGTGQHATTRMCATMVRELLAEDRQIQRVLDAGTGSGILAFCARVYGAARVWGYDYDAEAIDVARQNLKRNPLYHVDFDVVDIRNAVLPQVDLVTANLLASILRVTEPVWKRVLSPGAPLICSGVMSEQRDDLIRFYRERGWTLADSRRDGTWVALRFVREND